MDKNLNGYLLNNTYCNFNNPEIQDKADEIAGKIKDPTEKAIALFYWVRDNILYRVGLWNMTALETLKLGMGTCTNSANLLVAFLRYFEIPAGYGIMRVRGKELFGPAILPGMKKYINEVSTHVYATVFLNGKWIKVDPSDDCELSQNTFYYNPESKQIEWDGKNNAEIKINDKNIINNDWPVADITPWMKKKPKNGKGIKITIANEYIHFIRTTKIKFSSLTELQPFYLKYLFKSRPLLLIPFAIYYYYYKISLLFSRTESNKKIVKKKA